VKREDGDFVLGGGCGDKRVLLLTILLSPLFLIIGMFTRDDERDA